MDTLTREQRSALMSWIRGKGSRPELSVRRVAHRLGFRFRLHRRDLPGAPDLVFPRHRKVIFVHGCFWHQHHGCRRSNVPKSRVDYWGPKLSRNIVRDREAMAALHASRWSVLVVWECESTDVDALTLKLADFFGP